MISVKLEYSPRSLPSVSGIYLIQNIATGMKYVGSSNDVRGRAIGHMRKLRSNKHANRYLQASWVEHGESAFRWAIIEASDDISSLAKIEAFYISELRSGFGDAGFNLIINPGTGALADDVRRRMSESKKGRPAWNKGRPCPEHVKQASRTLLAGRIKTPQEVAKIRAAMLGPSHPHRGKRLLKEHCENLSRVARAKAPGAGKKYKGVNLDARTKTFMARIYVAGKQMFLGRYETEVEAAHAYNIAAMDHFGAGCFINTIDCQPNLNRRTVLGRPAREATHAE